MNTPAASYRRAVATLRPSRARMAAVHAQLAQERAAADAAIDTALAQGETVRGMYEHLCAIRPAPGQPDPAKVLRVTLLGRLRRGE